MSEQSLEVRRSSWGSDDLALLCGIANAGGGRLIVAPEGKSRAKSARRMHRVFEEVPALTTQAFGFACAAEPIMDGSQLCLEITVPPATEPLSFGGSYYLYTSHGNERLRREELQSHFDAAAATPIPNAPAERHGQSPSSGESGPAAATKARPHQPTFKDRSIAAARDIYLTSTDEYVLKMLNANGRATAVKIATLLGVSESTVRRSFRHLREHGLIERVGSDKAGYWKVLI